MNELSASLVVVGVALLAGSVAYACARRYAIAGDETRWTRWADVAFGASVALYLIVFGGLSLLAHWTFHSGNDTDLGQYSQMVWNSLHGRLYTLSLIPDLPLFLGKSFTPIVATWVPLYAVLPDPAVLLVLQTLALGVSAVPIYWLARRQVGAVLAFALGVAFLLSPIVQYINLTNFHEIAFAPLVLSLATFFLLRRRYVPLVACLSVAWLIKEELAFVTVGFGVLIILLHRRYLVGAALASWGALLGIVLLQYVIPFFHGAAPGAFYYFSGGQLAGGESRYGYLGRSLPEIFTTVLTRPQVVWAQVVIPEKITYLVRLFAPLAFAPLLGGELLILAAPTLAYTLLSSYVWQYSLRTAYPAPLIVFLFFAASAGLARLLPTRTNERAARQIGLAVGVLVAAAGNYWLFAPGPFAREFQPQRYQDTAHAATGRALLTQIPRAAVLVAQNEMLPHLATRRWIYEAPLIPDYRQAEYFFADTTGDWFTIHRGAWNNFFASGFFETIAQPDGFVVAKRRAPERALHIQFGEQMTLLGYSAVMTETAPWGATLRPVLEWRATQPITETFQIEVRVVDRQGHEWCADAREPLDGILPTPQWQVGKALGDQYTLRLPPTMPTGEYRITVAVRQTRGEAYLQARDASGRILGEEADVASVSVTKNKKSFAASDLQILNRRAEDFGALRLLGVAAPREAIAPGELLSLGLYWRAREKLREDYFIVAQLRDATGRIAFEHVARPAHDTYPTPQWESGEVLLDWHDFDLPENLAPGAYRIFVVVRGQNQTGLGEALIAPIVVVR